MRDSKGRGSFLSFFKFSAASMLFVTAAAKLVSAIGTQGVLDAPDPIIGIQNRILFLLLGGLELFFVFFLLKSKKAWLPSLLTSILGAQFILYHKVFALGQYSRGCPCMGTLAHWLPISQAATDRILVFIAAWLCLGGALACHFSYPYSDRAPEQDG